MRVRLGRGLAARRWAYRRGQSLVLAGLAGLVVAACASGPLYERAVEQATVRSVLGGAPRTVRGIEITADRIVPAASVASRGAGRALFATPISSGQLTGTLTLRGRTSLDVPLVYRDDVCAHLHLTSGRCATADGEVVISASSARYARLGLGQSITVRFAKNSIDAPVHVVGLYAPFAGDDDYWYETRYSTPSGYVVTPPSVDEAGGTALNAFFTTASEVATIGGRAQIEEGGSEITAAVTFPLRVERIGVEQMSTLRSELARLSRGDLIQTDESPDATSAVHTGLADLLARIDTGRRDARRAVLALGAQLAALGALCYLVVVLAAAEQRRPELALARLRGQGIGRTAGRFVRELAGLSLLAVVPGALAAWGLTVLAAHVWLVRGVPAEFGLAPLLAVVAAVLLLVLLAAAVGLRTSRAPVSDLLREQPPARQGRGLGVLEAVVVVAALAGLVATLRGEGSSPLTTFAPTLFAVLAGVALSRLLVLAGRRAGPRALRRRRLVPALAALGVARRTGGRLTATILCAATALVIFAGQQWSVAAANRTQRAAATTGAAVALDVATPSMSGLIHAVHTVDPHASWAAPLAVVLPPNVDSVPVMAVEPRSFGAVASWGRPALRPSQARLDALTPARQAPVIAVRATRLGIVLASSSVRPLSPAPSGIAVSAILRVLLRYANGASGYTDVGELPMRSTAPVTLTTEVRCADGCSISGFDIARVIPDTTPVAIAFTVSGARPGAAAVSIGPARSWRTTTVAHAITGLNAKDSMSARDTAAGLRFDAVDDGNHASMQYLDVPIGLPALLAGSAPDTRDELGYLTASGLDGRPNRVEIVGTLPFAPGLGPSALFVGLDLVNRTSGYIDALTSPQVWLRTDDPAREARLVAALRGAGARVLSRHASADLRRAYADSAPGWSARYALVVAGLAELLALGLLVLVLIASRRTREQDLAALRLTGVERRRLISATVIELVSTVLAGLVGGTLAGVLAVHLVLHRLPIFAAPPLVPLPAVFPLEGLWLAGSLALSAVLLLAAAFALAVALVRRARPDRYAGSTVT